MAIVLLNVYRLCFGLHVGMSLRSDDTVQLGQAFGDHPTLIHSPSGPEKAGFSNAHPPMHLVYPSSPLDEGTVMNQSSVPNLGPCA